MVRLILVVAGIVAGAYYSLQGPFYTLLFYVANAYFRPEEWVWDDTIRSLRLSFLIGILVVGSTLLSRHRFVWNGRIALLWIFAGIALLSAFLSDYRDYCWPYAVEFLKITIITYLLVVLTIDWSKVRLVVLVMVMALGVLQAKQGWVYLVSSPGWRNDNPIAFLGDNNGTAVGMLMLVPLIGFLMQSTDNKWTRRLFGLLLIGCLYRALSTYSRGGFLAAIAMGSMWCLRSSNKLRNSFGAVLVGAIVVPMLPSTFWDRMDTIQSYEEQRDQSALGRFHYWYIARLMAADNPVLGIGFNGYNKAYDSYDTSDGEFGRERSVHSSVFGVLAETGYLGLTVYLMILVSALRACAYSKKIAKKQPELGHVVTCATALETSLVAFAVGGSFVPLQYNEMLWHVVGLSIALNRITIRSQKQRLESTDHLDRAWQARPVRAEVRLS